MSEEATVGNDPAQDKSTTGYVVEFVGITFVDSVAKKYS